MTHIIHKFGRNNAVANGAWEDIWSVGGKYVWPEAGSVIHIVSSTASDTAVGTGARSITVQGLSTSFEEIQETINTAGTSTAAGSLNFQRVNRAFVEDSGTYSATTAGGNAGTINILTAGGAAHANIDVETGVGLGQTQVARFTVPLNETAFIRHVDIHANASKPADVAWFQRQNADVVAAPFKSRRLVEYYDGVDGANDVSHHDTPWGPFPEKTDIWFVAKGNGAATAVSANFELTLFVQGQEPEFG